MKNKWSAHRGITRMIQFQTPMCEFVSIHYRNLTELEVSFQIVENWLKSIFIKIRKIEELDKRSKK